jgi:neutral ceramidase
MRRTLPVFALAMVAHCTSAAPVAPDADVAALDAGPIDDLATVDVAAPVDAPVDAPEPADVLELPTPTDHCRYEPVAATARAGGTVAEGPVSAGTAERVLDLPVGSALGAYTARVRALGNASALDARDRTLAGWFNPSVGYETRPMVRALALTAGDETVLLLKADLGVADEAILDAVTARLGPAFAGKVIFATSHSHSAPGHTVAHEGYGILGFGPLRAESQRRLVDALVGVAEAALAARAPARVGIAHDGAFDPTDAVSRDRRPANDDLPRGRRRKDNDLFVLRVDAADGTPLAIVPVVGVHPTVLDSDNNLMATDASGAIERALEERFDRRVLVMHLQGAAGDVSPAGAGGFDCGAESRGPARFCYDFARVEGLGRTAAAMVHDVWRRAGDTMRDRVAMEMLTRTIPLGTDWRTFTVRDGGLAYAPFEPGRAPDRRIFDDAGALLSPVDEFNAAFGAALCGSSDVFVEASLMPGTAGLPTYASCQRIEALTPLLGLVLGIRPAPVPPNRAACGSTRTVVSALRLGEHVFVTLPGEPLTLLADRVRALSPAPADRTVVVGYANSHMGYVLTAEDWLRAGYEPGLNFWGPLEGEHIAEEAVALARLAFTPQREDTGSGTTRWVAPTPDALPPTEASARAGAVPDAVPREVYARRFPDWTTVGAQPPERVARLGGARFTWIGEDPRAGTPVVRVEAEAAPGSDRWSPLRRRSGREVRDGDLLVTWTPVPLQRVGTEARTHYWVAEWQAVPSWGDARHDALEDRLALPTGRYRFAVEGTGYRVQSRSFEVVGAPLRVSAVRAGARVTLEVSARSAEGWRLLSLRSRPGEALPLPRGPVSVELVLADGARRTIADVAVDANGRASVELGADAAAVRRCAVTDPYGNRGDVALE